MNNVWLLWLNLTNSNDVILVNVTKNFADMKSMEREHERENVHIARKLGKDEVL